MGAIVPPAAGRPATRPAAHPAGPPQVEASLVPPHQLVGEGPHRIVAVHGWLSDRAAFTAMLPHVDRRSCTYVLPDLRGYGEARDIPGTYTTSEAAGDLIALVDHLGWDRFSLLGHAMGGAVVQRVAAAVPHRVLSLVGVAAVPASGMPLEGERWELFTAAAGCPDSRRKIIDWTTGSRHPGVWLDLMVRHSWEHSDAAACRAWLDSWAREDFHREVEGSQVPVRLVVGAHDPALTAELMRRTWLRWYAQAEVVELACAGHYPADEAPLELVRSVEDFVVAGG